MNQPKRKTPSPREAAQLAEQMQALAQMGVAPNIEMTAQEFADFKKQLWWGREFYSGLGLTTMFAGLGTKRSFATKLADRNPRVDPAHEDSGHASLSAGFACEASSTPSASGVDRVLDGDNPVPVVDDGRGDAPGQCAKEGAGDGKS